MDEVIEREKDDWDLVITTHGSIFKLNLKEVWNYRYLLMMFVKRDIVSVYKQTILGPLWFFIQPILTTIVYVVIFGNIAKIPTDGLPPVLFYLAGITIWNYFAEILTTTSNTFLVNASIFGKVYFPRLVLPLSKVVSGLIKFCIQFILFLFVFFFYLSKGSSIHPNILGIIFVTPVVLVIMAGLGLGFGLILSALTTKYRDLTFLISFGIQLGMYATPVIYPLSAIHSKYKVLIEANPMTSLVESFRKVYLGAGDLNWAGLLYSFGFMVVILILGIIIFNQVERTFIDTV
jgi:lipopolysaccharide transport system permease protein